jgi:glycosyltransferase involved in cell wall biosynthesis
MRALEGVAATFPEAELVVVGDRRVFEAAPFAKKREFGFLTYKDYMAVMRRCDICLSPLADAPGLAYKSDAKFLDAGATASVFIGSPTVYAESVVHGETGFIAQTPEDWARVIASLLGDPELRARIAANGWRYVRDNRMFAHQAQLRRDWYRGLWERRDSLNRELIERNPRIRQWLPDPAS